MDNKNVEPRTMSDFTKDIIKTRVKSLLTALRDIRISRGLTLQEASQITGLKPNNISRLERGLYVPPLNIFFQILYGYESKLTISETERILRVTDSSL